jgi:hypothetical protein
VEYTITGTQKNVIYLGDKLDEWTAGIREWYSAFYRGVLALALFFAVVIGPIWLWNNASPHLLPPAFVKAHDWLQGAIIVSLWVAIYWTLSCSRVPRLQLGRAQSATGSSPTCAIAYSARFSYLYSRACWQTG